MPSRAGLLLVLVLLAAPPASAQDRVRQLIEDPKASLDEIPAFDGLRLDRLPTWEELQALTRRYAVEFALTSFLGAAQADFLARTEALGVYPTDAKGTFFLHAGTEAFVNQPEEPSRTSVAHTHPERGGLLSGASVASPRDRLNLLTKGQRLATIVPENGSPFLYTPRSRRLTLGGDEATEIRARLEAAGVLVATAEELREFDRARGEFVAATDEVDPALADRFAGLTVPLTEAARAVLSERTIADVLELDRRLLDANLHFGSAGRLLLRPDGSARLAEAFGILDRDALSEAVGELATYPDEAGLFHSSHLREVVRAVPREIEARGLVDALGAESAVTRARAARPAR